MVIVSRYSRDVILLHLREERLAGQDLRDRYLVAADLRGLDCGGTDFRRALLRRADLREASLRGADLSGTDLRQADLTGADLTGAILDGALWDERTIWPSDFRPVAAQAPPHRGKV